MVMPLTGLDRIRDLVKDDITHGELGTGDTNPAQSDTDLETPVAATKIAPTVITGNRSISSSLVIPTSTGNGNTYTETGTFLNTTVLMNRKVFSGLAKTSSQEYTILTIFDIQSI